MRYMNPYRSSKQWGLAAGLGWSLSLAITVTLLFVGSGIVRGQGTASAVTAPLAGADGKPLTFEVVSIRPESDGPPRGRAGAPPDSAMAGTTPDGYRQRGMPLLAAIQGAYAPSKGRSTFRPSQIEGVPAWALSGIHYDIDARVSEADLPRWKDPAQQPAMMRAMLQAMLADRFKLVAHVETKMVPVYELLTGRGAPKFKPATTGGLDEIKKKYPNAHQLANGPIVATGPNPGQQNFFDVSMGEIATMLSTLAGRPILDKTGLTGRYDMSYQMELPPPPQERSAEGIAADFFSSQISTIVQDQLGLKLHATTGPAEMLVIEHVEQPSVN